MLGKLDKLLAIDPTQVKTHNPVTDSSFKPVKSSDFSLYFRTYWNKKKLKKKKKIWPEWVSRLDVSGKAIAGNVVDF